MAEGFARALAPEGVGVYSAGSAPAVLHPLAVEVMREVGIDIGGQRSKSVADIPGDAIGTVVTLCAEEVCPAFPGVVRRLHWPFPDPAAARGSREQRLRSFRQVRDGVREKVEALFPGGAVGSALNPPLVPPS